ncbi:Protein of unknown function [Cotesia congregata]|uniref:Uncharacterized protein n=1 Tax=Cotesia congregata TaxID=51543 RepID=A0A8J2H9N0_COTCN|nr:Protein of unknown function [Cotesia congregata]
MLRLENKFTIESLCHRHDHAAAQQPGEIFRVFQELACRENDDHNRYKAMVLILDCESSCDDVTLEQLGMYLDTPSTGMADHLYESYDA